MEFQIKFLGARPTMKTLILFGILAVAMLSGPAFSCLAADQKASEPFTIRDEQTAIQFAQVVIRSEFGNSEFRALKRYEARRDDDEWIVRGFRTKKIPKTTHGGVAVVRLKSNGCVVSVGYDI
ncbi:MAG TPA: NTF2 fold immunity protein [Terriglobales bacterium]|nr:NTF2 fold immunity protein [Terriglobales bacterium]